MMHLAPSFAPGFAVLLVTLGGCSKITMVVPEDPLEISAQPPAPPLPELAAVKQPPPPPPPRVVVEKVEFVGEVLRLDEAIGFDEKGKLLSADHQDIFAEVAAWLAANPDVAQLKVQVHGYIEKKHIRQKRTKALAKQVVDALVNSGVDAEQVVAVDGRASHDGPFEVTLEIVRDAEEKPE